MKNVTILLQGKILQETIDFFVKHYPNQNVVVSTTKRERGERGGATFLSHAIS